MTLARISGAAGFHLDQEDAATRDARAILSPDAIVGRSAGTLDEALDAVHHGADYLGVGAIYATPTKPEGDIGGLGLVGRSPAPTCPYPGSSSVV